MAEKQNESRVSQIILGLRSLFPIALFLASLGALSLILKEYSLDEVLSSAREVSRKELFIAAIFCALNYALLGAYDAVACRCFSIKLPLPKILVTAFTSYALSQTIGLSFVSNAAVRFRFYGSWGVPLREVLRISLFGATCFWWGLLFLLGVSSLVEPNIIASALHLSPIIPQALGVLSLLASLAFITVPRPLIARYLGERLLWVFPSRMAASIGLLIAISDWLLAATTLYWVFPGIHEITWIRTINAFIVGQLLGLVSHLPGGIGVFETSVAFLLSGQHTPAALLGALVVYRFLYYLVPFVLGLFSLTCFEAFRLFSRRPELAQKTTKALRLGTSVVPPLLAGAVFVAGIVLLLSGASPTAGNRAWWVTDIVPLVIIESSHFVNSVVGTSLLVLALSLRKRLESAWVITVILLVAGAVATFIKGLDFEEAIYLLLVALWLFLSRSHFSRRGLLLTRFTWKEASAIVIAVASSVWLGFFSYRDVDYSHALWWEFAATSDAPRFLRASVVSAVLLMVISLLRLLRVAPHRAQLPSVETLRSLKELINKAGDTEANVALLGDKFLLQTESKQAFIMYQVSGRSWVSMGDPVSPEEDEVEALVWQFRELCDQHDGLCVFYEVSTQHLPVYIDAGFDLLKLGEQAMVHLEDFSLEGSRFKSFRQGSRRLEKDGCAFEIVDQSVIEPLLPELKKVSNAWLEDKDSKEKGFSLGYFDEAYLRNFDVALVRASGRIIAFANIWKADNNRELSVDLMRFAPGGPGGLMDYLFTQLLLWGKENKFERFNLGMAPFSGLSARPLAPFWNRAGGYLFRHGEHFYNFKGLRSYKEKYHPEWQPKYLASPGGLKLPIIFANIASLISRGRPDSPSWSPSSSSEPAPSFDEEPGTSTLPALDG